MLFSQTRPYLLSIVQQVQAVMRRRVQIIRGNMLATGLNLLSVFSTTFGLAFTHLVNSSFVFQGIIMGSVFLKSPETTGAFFSRGGILFLYVKFKICLYAPD